MRKFFYARLAATNIKNNAKTYFPYILTCIGTVLMFYNMCTLTFHKTTGNGSLAILMLLGVFVTGIFSFIFLYYTNSFLMKRRKKEFGLFNILGMEKRHIGRVIIWENIITSVISLSAGLIAGIAFSKLITLMLYKLLHFNPNYSFSIPPNAVIMTLGLFLLIFITTLLSSLFQIWRAKPVELLSGGNVGEKEPRSNLALAVCGIITLLAGYYVALITKENLAVVFLFFIAALLVIIGTYCIFTAGSIVLLKALRKNKNFYYQTKHFISLSSMLYRMKKNAVGLANICIMSTAVLVMVSTTVSLYIGINDSLNYRYPTDAVLTCSYQASFRPDTLKLSADIKEILDTTDADYEDFKSYEYLNFTAIRQGNNYTVSPDFTGATMNNTSVLIFLSVDEYNYVTNESVTLKENEAIIYSAREMSEITIIGEVLSVKQCYTGEVLPVGQFRAWVNDLVFVIVDTQDTVCEFYELQKSIYNDNASTIKYELCFNLNGTDGEIVNYFNSTLSPKLQKLETPELNISSDIKQIGAVTFYELYGGLFFLGIFLGTLFLLATVLIIYYKQVIEGIEDKERFRIMRNVGLSNREIKQTVGSQILTVFALPLAAAVVHILVAFPILKHLLALLNLTNSGLFMLCTAGTIVVFALIYALVYALTSRIYYKTVNS